MAASGEMVGVQIHNIYITKNIKGAPDKFFSAPFETLLLKYYFIGKYQLAGFANLLRITSFFVSSVNFAATAPAR